MRKIITTTFLTLDGVMQAPGGPEEGFAYGGWEMPFQADAMMDSIMNGYMSCPFELLLGKTTYDIFASFWPSATTDLEATVPFNRTKKYVVAHEAFAPVVAQLLLYYGGCRGPDPATESSRGSGFMGAWQRDSHSDLTPTPFD